MDDLKKIKNIDKLAEAFLWLKGKEECKKFLRDVCTMGELRAMSERLTVMFMIAEGTPYREISKQTGVSTTTITRVANWLKHGAGGYEIVLKRMGEKR